MRITVAPSNIRRLEIQAVVLDNRPVAERWIRILQKQIDLLWPKQKPEVKK